MDAAQDTLGTADTPLGRPLLHGSCPLPLQTLCLLEVLDAPGKGWRPPGPPGPDSDWKLTSQPLRGAPAPSDPRRPRGRQGHSANALPSPQAKRCPNDAVLQVGEGPARGSEPAKCSFRGLIALLRDFRMAGPSSTSTTQGRALPSTRCPPAGGGSVLCVPGSLWSWHTRHTGKPEVRGSPLPRTGLV